MNINHQPYRPRNSMNRAVRYLQYYKRNYGLKLSNSCFTFFIITLLYLSVIRPVAIPVRVLYTTRLIDQNHLSAYH